MRNNFIIVIASLVAIIMICASPAFTKVWAKVNGSVKAEDGTPIQGAKVILVFSEDGSTHELTTDAKGRWSKVDMRPGAWTIGFMAEGYEPKNFNMVLSAIKKNPPIDITLTPIPKHPLSKGNELYEQKKYAEALQEYQRVLAENQDLYEVHDRIGLCYYRLNDLENAIKAFKRMLEKEPHSRDTLINLSAIYLQKGNLEEGLKYFKQLDEESLKDHGTFYNIGVLLFNNNQMDMAIEYFKKCLTRNPNYVDGYFQLALAHLNKGDMEEAKANLKKIIEIAPESEKAALAKEMLNDL
jgi:tetratricopeptide (TPR) repeat protein